MVTTLPAKTDIAVKRAIRSFCKNKRSPEGFNMYQLAHKKNIGLEECEEIVAGLLAEGWIKFYYTKHKLYIGFPYERRSNVDRRKN